MKNTRITRFIFRYLISGIAFFLLTMPFQKMLSVFTLTEVRPSAVLYPLLGISFGWPSALGIMTANFICDNLFGYSAAILYEGLVLQVLYTIVPYYLWKRITIGEDHIHRLDCVGRVLKYVLTCLVFSILSAVGVGLVIGFNYHINTTQTALFVLQNNFNMSVILGCPLMVIANQIISRRSGSKRVLTQNEIIILFTAGLQVLLMIFTIIIVYAGGKTIGTYDIWNTIYIIGSVNIGITMLLSLICMVCFEKFK